MTFVQHSLKEFIRDERAWQRALDQPPDLATSALTANAHDTCWYLFHRGTSENARSLQFAERLRSSSFPRSLSRELSVSSTSSLRKSLPLTHTSESHHKTDKEAEETVTVIDLDESDENVVHHKGKTCKSKINKDASNAFVANRLAEHLKWNKSMKLSDAERANMDILQRLFARNLQKHFRKQRAILHVTNTNNKSNRSDNKCMTETKEKMMMKKKLYADTRNNHEEFVQRHNQGGKKYETVTRQEKVITESELAGSLISANMAVIEGYFYYYFEQLRHLESVQRSNIAFRRREQLCKYYNQFYETLFLIVSEDEYNARHLIFSTFVKEHITMMNEERENFALMTGMPFEVFVSLTKLSGIESKRRLELISAEENEMKKYAQLSYLYELNLVNEHLAKCKKQERRLKRNQQQMAE